LHKQGQPPGQTKLPKAVSSLGNLQRWKPSWVTCPTAGLPLPGEASLDIQAEPLISAFPPCLPCVGRAWLCFLSKPLAGGCCEHPPNPLLQQTKPLHPLVFQQGPCAPGCAGSFKLFGLIAPICQCLSCTGGAQNWAQYSGCDLPSAGQRGQSLPLTCCVSSVCGCGGLRREPV